MTTAPKIAHVKSVRNNRRCTVSAVVVGNSDVGKTQSNQKVSVDLVIEIQKVTSNVQSVPRQSPDIY
jgi:hypothetical protein